MAVQPDGTARIDVDRMAQKAIEMGQASHVAWYPEEQQITPHPIQTPPPELEPASSPRADV
jgi:hypothetical protein